VRAITGRTGSGGCPGKNLLVVCKRGEVVHCMRPLEVETSWVKGSVLTDMDRVGGWPL
jgi:hypothetical protein